MKKFDNVEMTEEELDNVTGGQKTATIEHPEDGHTSIPTLDIEHDEIKTKENGNVRLYMDPDLERKMREYPGVIFY
jgi:bacteriocin-like protein